MNHIIRCRKGKDLIEINLCKSAPIQIKPIPIVKELGKYWADKGYTEIIDVGCGKLRNSLALINYFSLWICDFPEQMNNPIVLKRLESIKKKHNFKGIIYPNELEKGQLNLDAAFICFVLHTIPKKQLRIQLIENTVKNLKPPYEIFIAVPYGEKYYKQKFKKENQLLDGHIFNVNHGQKTYYREYSSEQIDNFMKEIGFIAIKSFSADRKKLRCYRKK